MIINDNYIKFVPEYDCSINNVKDEDKWLIFYKNKCLIKLTNNDEITFPCTSEIKKIGLKLTNIQKIGNIESSNFYIAESEMGEDNNENYMLYDLRTLASLISDEMFLICSRASLIMNWHKNNRFCSRCGSEMKVKQGEIAKECSNCGFIVYPRLSPAIIVAVVKGDKLLLAHNTKFPAGRYSVIAGFVEAGETFEQSVKREVLEEVGLKVKNIKYFASQPWPFPDSLMVAFTAEYDDNDIQVDNVEISHAAWFSVNEIPNIPSSGSVARKLIDWFAESR